jgi:hypothetical protein
VITCGLDWVRLRRSGLKGGGVRFDHGVGPVGGEFAAARGGAHPTDRAKGLWFIAGAGTVIGGERSISPRPLPPWGSGDYPRAFEAREAIQVPIVEGELHTRFQERGVYGRGRPSPLSSGQSAKP